VLAIGLVVDDAIVVLENIVRRIEEGERPLIAAVDGSKEIAFAVIATTLALIAVFLPISFIPGSIGRLFGEFGISVAAAIFFSSIIALTLTPMMASKLFAGGIARGRTTRVVDGAFRWLANYYERSLARTMRYPWAMAALCVVVSGLGYALLRQLPSEYTPAEDRGSVSINVTGPEGASIQYMDSQLRPVEAAANAELDSGVANRAVVRVGSGGGGRTSAGAVNTGRIIMSLNDWGQRDESSQQVATRIRRQVGDLPGLRVSVITPSGLGGRSAGQPVQFVLGGPSYDELVRWRDIVIARARDNPGLIGVESDYYERRPQINVAIARDRAAMLGVSLETVGRTLETMLGSRNVTTYVDRGEEYNVLLQARAEDRATPSDLNYIYVRSEKSRELVPLSNLVHLEEIAGPSDLNRLDRLRSITISAGLAEGYSLGEALKFLEDVVHEELPSDAKINYNGQSREFLQSGSGLYVAFLMAIGIVYLVLAAQFESFRHPAIIIVTVPLAIAGAVLGLWWQGGSINIYSQIGAVMLIGLATKNGILIVEFANQLRDRGVEFGDAILQASGTRLRPVLMTSLCTVFGAIPLLIATGAGAESRQSIGAVIVFGVTFSLVLTLYIVPAMYTLVARNTRSPEYVSRLIEQQRGAE
jgi:multidrug efflux pump